MRHLKKIFKFICLAALLIACNRPQPIKTTEFTGNAMTINYRIVIGSTLTKEQQKHIDRIIQTTFNEIHTTYNKWNPDSEITLLNTLPAHTPKALSPQLHRFLQFTDNVVKLTDGRFDPTIEPLQSLWKTHLTNGNVPDDSQIDAVKQLVGWDKIHFEDGIFTKDHDGVMLDLGGIAKGLAVDLLVENIAKENISSIYVEWGGEIKTQGMHPYKRPWRISINRFEDTNANNAIAIVELNEMALATSGDYLQKWKVDDGEYFHVLDPSTCHALKIGPHTLGSASVACKSCALADGLATATLTFSTESEASRWLDSLQNEYPELRYWLLSRSSLDSQ